MIRYALKCAEGHSFESWFQSAGAYDKLAAAGMVTCAVCGSASVEKAIMAPRVRPARSAAVAPQEARADGSIPAQGMKNSGEDGSGLAPASTQLPAGAAAHALQASGAAQEPALRAGEDGVRPSLSAPGSDVERALQELRKKVEANSDYVGGNFADEARAMHLGDVPTRAIHGEAKPEEARELIEEGVPVMPLPFLPNRKTN